MQIEKKLMQIERKKNIKKNANRIAVSFFISIKKCFFFNFFSFEDVPSHLYEEKRDCPSAGGPSCPIRPSVRLFPRPSVCTLFSQLVRPLLRLPGRQSEAY